MAGMGDTDKSQQLIKRFPAYCHGLLGYAPRATLFSGVLHVVSGSTGCGCALSLDTGTACICLLARSLAF